MLPVQKFTNSNIPEQFQVEVGAPDPILDSASRLRQFLIRFEEQTNAIHQLLETMDLTPDERSAARTHFQSVIDENMEMVQQGEGLIQKVYEQYKDIN
jgi:hypothetical protein